MKKRTPLVIFAIVVIYSFLSFTETKVVYSQTAQTIQCGDIVEDEFTQDFQEQNYLLKMKPGDSFAVSVVPTGDLLSTAIGVYGPTNIRFGLPNDGEISKTPMFETTVLSARGEYRVRIANAKIAPSNSTANDELINPRGGVGEYRLLISCVVDGMKIEAGSQLLTASTPTSQPKPISGSVIPINAPNFTGFPGLAPVDFSDIASAPLVLDVPNVGRLPSGNEILGFTVDAAAGDALDLSYTRRSGNMNLGVVVLSEDNKVFFQASLVTSESLSTTFSLPEAGQYTIGIFRIGLVEPEAVEPTVFQLQGSLKVAE